MKSGIKNKITWWIRCHIPFMDKIFPLSEEEFKFIENDAIFLKKMSEHLKKFPKNFLGREENKV